MGEEGGCSRSLSSSRAEWGKGGEGITEEEGGEGGGISFFPTPHFEFCTHDFFFAPPSSEKATGLGNEPKMQEQKRMPRCSRNLLYLQQPFKRARSPQFGMSVEIPSPVFSHLCPERACPGGQSGHLLFPFVFQED